MHGTLNEFGCARCAAAAATSQGATSQGAGSQGAGSYSANRAAGPGNGWKNFALPGSPTQWSRDRKFDVEHLRLDVEIDPETKSVRGTVTHRVRPFLDGLTQVELDCCELEVSKVTANGRACSFTVDGGKLRATLRSPAPKGRPLRIAVEYSGTPRRGLYFTGADEHRPTRQTMVWTQGQDEDSRFWFPCFDFPNEKQTTEVVATVPAGMRALSNGRLLRHRRAGRGRTETWHWKLDVPHVAYLVTLVVGDFEVAETKWRGIPVTYWAPKGRMADVKRTLARTPRMLTHFSRRTGFAYPYPQYAQVFVQDFIFGGMENTTATTLTDTAILDADAAKEVWMDGLVAHELGHQWFGDLVTCRDWSQGWLNEGFATFMEVVWKREADGEDEAAYYRMGEQQAYLDEDGGSYRRPIVCRTWNDPIEVFDRHLYQKGACVLAMLSRELGEDLFWASVKRYLEQHAWGSVVTDDLRRAIEDTTGRNLEWFFDQWVHHGGHPELDLSWSEEKGSITVRVAQKQRVDEMTPLFRFGLDVRVVTERGKVDRHLEVTEASQTFTIPVPGRAKWVAFDPGAQLLHSGKVSQSDFQWAQCLEGDEDGATRVRAVRALGESGTPPSVRAVAKALARDSLWFVRAEAARALGSVRGDVARDALLARAGDRDPRVRSAVAAALGSFRHDEKAAAGLSGMLHDRERSPTTLFEAAASLGRTRSATARERLVRQLGRKSWNDLAKRGAAAGLGELADDEAIPVLLAETAPDRPDLVRATAAAAVGRLGRDKESDRRTIRERLEEFVHSGHLRVQLAAISALADRRDPRALGALHTQAERDLDGRVKRQARVAASAISTGLDRGDEVRRLRDDMERLRVEQRKTLDRLERLERGKK